MIIKRDYFKNIRKRKIPLNNLVRYEDIDINILNGLINRVISDNIYSTIDLLNLVMKHYGGNILDTISKIDDYSIVRFNCFHACKLLKARLTTLNITSYLISYKSIGFSDEYGDFQIKEAHMSLVIPTLKNDKIYYILMDPGLRIPEVMCFYQSDASTNIIIDNDDIRIEKCNDGIYNYTMIMEGSNRYSTSSVSYRCQEYFDLNHELLNPEDVLFPSALYVLSGYRIIRFNTNKAMQASIKILLEEEMLEISSCKEYKKVSFRDLENIEEKKFAEMIKELVNILDINESEFYPLIKFIIDKKEELKSIRIKDAL